MKTPRIRFSSPVEILAVAFCFAWTQCAPAQTGPGYALSLNGSGAYVSVPNDAAFNFSSAMTIEAWMQKIAAERALSAQPRSLQDELTPEEWVRQFREWGQSHGRTTPLLSDEAISRESIYPGRV